MQQYKIIVFSLCLAYVRTNVNEKYNFTRTIVSSTMIKLHWPAPKNLVAEPAFYLITYNDQSVRVNNTKVMLKNLAPSTNYTITVSVCTADCRILIGPLTLRTQIDTLIRIENIAVTKVNSTHVRITWDPPLTASNFVYNVRVLATNFYLTFYTNITRVDLLRPSCQTNETSVFQKISIKALSSDSKNKTKVTAYSGNLNSTILFYLDCFRFNSADNKTNFSKDELKIKKMIVSKTRIKLWWDPPKNMNDVKYYTVDYNKDSIRINETEVALMSLKSNTDYQIKISAYAINCTISSLPVVVRTKIEIPQKVKNLSIKKINSTCSSIHWDPCSNINNLDQFYNIRIKFNHTFNEFNISDTHILISTPDCENQELSFTYTITVATVNVNALDRSFLIGDPVSIILLINCIMTGSRQQDLLVAEHDIKENNTSSIPVPFKYTQYTKTFDEHGGIENNTETLSNYSVSDKEYDGVEDDYETDLSDVNVNSEIRISVKDVTTSSNSSLIRVSWKPPSRIRISNLIYSVRTEFNNVSWRINTNDTYAEIFAGECESAIWSNKTYVFTITVASDVTGYISEPSTTTFECSTPSSISKPIIKFAFTKIIVSRRWIKIDWSASINTNISLSKYTIKYNGNIREGNTSFTLTDLQPDTNYEVEISECLKCPALIGPLILRTGEMIPITVENLLIESVNSTHVTVTWKPPLMLISTTQLLYGVQIKFDEKKFSVNTTYTRVNLEVLVCDDHNLNFNYFVITVIILNAYSFGYNSITSSIMLYVNCQTRHKLNNVVEKSQTKIKEIIVTNEWIELEWTSLSQNNESQFISITYNNHSILTNDTKLILNKIKPNINYTIGIRNCEKELRCSPIMNSFIIRTKTVLTLKVENITVQYTNESYIRFFWKPPAQLLNISMYSVLINENFTYTSKNTYIEIPTFLTKNSSVLKYKIAITILDTEVCAKNLFICETSSAELFLYEIPSSSNQTIIRATKTRKSLIYEIVVSSTWIKLKWDYSDMRNGPRNFRIDYNDCSIRTNDTNIILATLMPNTSYTIQIYECVNNCTVLGDVFKIRTNIEDRKNNVKDVIIENINSTYTRLTWNRISNRTAKNDFYIIQTKINENYVQFKTTDTFADIRMPFCKNYKSNLTIKISAEAETFNYESAAESMESVTFKFYIKCCESTNSILNFTICSIPSFFLIIIIIVVNVIGFLLGLMVSFYKIRKFSYVYEIRKYT
ncbi:hypothetical protein PGB90_000374 [Kerria lacca]